MERKKHGFQITWSGRYEISTKAILGKKFNAKYLEKVIYVTQTKEDKECIVFALGFHKAHIWSCAPNHKNPYWIFKNNSKSYRNQEALNTWYERLLKTGQWHYELIQNTQRNRPEELQVFPGDVKQIAKQAGVLTGANIFIVDLTKNCSWFNRYFEEVKLFDSSKVTERSTMLKEDFGSEISAHVATSKVLKELLANYGDSVEYNSHRICNPNWSQKD